MANSSADRNPLDLLAEEFVERYRKGERPSLTEYAERSPKLADEIRDLFPALVEMEQLKPVTGDHTGDFQATQATDPVRLGEFRILRRVGVGGMGVVYEAVQESLGRHVALKLMPAEALADAKRLERFRREAKAAARLHHTNIVPVFGTGEADGRHYYAMQFIAGHPLDAVIDEVRNLKANSGAVHAPTRAVSEVAAAMITNTFAGGEQDLTRTLAPGSAPPSPSGSSMASGSVSLSGSISDSGRHYFTTVARIGEQVAEALAYAHGQGILHRDIKPANLLLDLQGTVWVTDFGLAKANESDDLTQAGDIVGTLRYMAPERFDGSGDHRADVYALGLTLYEMLTLKPAFAAENRAKLVEQVVAASPPNPRSINAAIPRDLETVVLKAIQRDPAMRYQSASAMAEDLRRVMEDRPIEARRASKREQAWRWCRRNPAVAGLLATVLVVFGLGATVATLFARQQQKTAIALEQTLVEKDKTTIALDATLDEVRKQSEKAVERQKDLELQQDHTRRVLYASQINHAQLALNDFRIPRLVELLDDTKPKPGEPDLRGWEWHYLNRQIRPAREVKLYDGDVIGGNYMAGYGGGMSAVSFDGRRVALPERAGDLSYVFGIWDTQTGKRIGQVPRTTTIPLNREGAFGISSLPMLRPSMSPEGGYLFLRYWKSGGWNPLAPDKPVPDSQIWNVSTGEATTVPAKVLKQSENSLIVVGPVAAWLAWLTYEDQTFGGVRRNGPASVMASRWNRETGAIVNSPRISLGEGIGRVLLSPDARTLYWQPIHSMYSTDESTGLQPKAVFEFWDVEATPPRRRGDIIRMDPKDFTGNTGVHFSAQGTYMAIRGDHGIHVCDAKNARQIWTAPVPQELKSHSNDRSRAMITNLSVSDDGQRIAILGANGLYIIDRKSKDANTSAEPRRYPVTNLDLPNSGNTGTSYMFTDNDHFQIIDVARRLVRTWDLSRNPASDRKRQEFGGVVAKGADGRRMRTFVLPDGRGTVVFPVSESYDPSYVGVRTENDTPPKTITGDGIVRNAAGAEVNRLPVPSGSFDLFPEITARGRRLLVNYYITKAPDALAHAKQPIGRSDAQWRADNQWRLYDIDNNLKEVASGAGDIHPTGHDVGDYDKENKSYLLESPRYENSFWYSGGHEFVLRDELSGKLIQKFVHPHPSGKFHNPDFDAGGRKMLVTSLTDTQPEPLTFDKITPASLALGGSMLAAAVQTPIENMTALHNRRLEVCCHDLITGKELWRHDLGVQESSRPSADFSPDGKRVLVRYMTVGADQAAIVDGPRTVRTPRSVHARVWVGNADGQTQHDLIFPDTKTNFRGWYGGMSSEVYRFAFSPDNRHVAIPFQGEVQIWNLDSGTRIHRLTGHESTPGSGIGMQYSADGMRIFTSNSNDSLNSGAIIKRLHVWDVKSGRELLIIPFEAGNADTMDLKAGKLTITGMAGSHIFDGSPVTP